MPLLRRLLDAVPDRCYRLVLIVCALYSVIAVLIPLARLVPRLPLQLGIPVILYLVYSWKGFPEAAKRWVYYFAFTASYQCLRFAVSSRAEPFHGAGVIAMEQRIFGVLPTVWLQNQLHPGPGFNWYDYVFAILHASLFAFPLLLPGILLWRRGAAHMKRATVALTFISFAGYLTYILFPLTPPWMAWLEGSIPEVDRVVYRALRTLTGSWLAGAFQPSPRGAMPSLHAGLPFMTLLIGLHEFRWKAWWVALPVFGICFEVIYGAEHYVIDIFAGILYGAVAYLLAYRYLLPDKALAVGFCGEGYGGGAKRHNPAPG